MHRKRHPSRSRWSSSWTNVTNETVQALIGIDQVTSNAAMALGKTGISGPDANAVLGEAVASNPAVLTAITIDTDGTVLSAEPADAKVLLGQRHR